MMIQALQKKIAFKIRPEFFIVLSITFNFVAAWNEFRMTFALTSNQEINLHLTPRISFPFRLAFCILVHNQICLPK